jgi:hypothetical protein
MLDVEKIKNDTKRTDAQNRALHLWFQLLADELNREGKSMSLVLQKFILDAPATKFTIKELVWRPLQESLYGKHSTCELLKKEEIDKIYDTLVKFFAEELEVSCPPFPSLEGESFVEKYDKK